MKQKSIFEKYYKKLAKEGLLKSLLIAISTALILDATVALALYFTPYNGLWISVAVAVGVCALLTPVLYFLKFRPTTKAIAARLDSLGLEERILTMNELENDESYIAMRQREDALAALNSVNPKNVKITVSRALIVVLAVSVVMSSAMTTVTALANKGVIPGGDEIIDNNKPDSEKYYTIQYVAVDYSLILYIQALGGSYYFPVKTDISVGAMFEGSEEQIVAIGENGEPFLAMADPDWAFYGWLDGSSDPYRVEESVLVLNDAFDSLPKTAIYDYETEKYIDCVYDEARGWHIMRDEDGKITVYVYALFAPVGNDNDGDGGSGGGDDISEEDPDAPSDPEEEPSESDKDNKENQPDKGEDGKGDDNKQDPSAGNKENNNVIDGKQDYQSRIEEYEAKAEEYLKNGQDIPEWIQEYIKNYYGTL